MVRTDLQGIFCRSLLVLTKVLFSICSSLVHYLRVCPAVIVGVSNHHCRRRRRSCCLVIISRLSWQGQSFPSPLHAPFWHIHSNCFVFRGCACCDCLCCHLLHKVPAICSKTAVAYRKFLSTFIRPRDPATVYKMQQAPPPLSPAPSNTIVWFEG